MEAAQARLKEFSKLCIGISRIVSGTFYIIGSSLVFRFAQVEKAFLLFESLGLNSNGLNKLSECLVYRVLLFYIDADMNSTSDFVLYNLYIDESGFYYIGEPRYRFFILSAVIISPDQKSLIDLLFANFRNKYLIKPDKCFHAADFFEDHAPNYKKRELKMPRIMHKAVEDLIDIMSHVKFDALSSYCDIPRIRKRLIISEPPIKNPLMSQIEIAQYRLDKNQYRQNIEKTIGNKRNCPLTMTINKSLQFHSAMLAIHEENEIYHRPVKGYINFESQKESDSIIIDNFHKYQDTHYTYGDNLIGINLHTKGSLDGGIQLADLISYITCQSLRSKYDLHHEILLSGIMLKYVRYIRKVMAKKYQIKMFNVSEMDI